MPQTLLFFLLWLFAAGACAQTDTTVKKADDRLWNVVKLDPALLIHGDLPVHYERVLVGRLTAQASVGFLMRDYFYHTVQEIGSSSNKDKNGSLDETKMGFSFRVGPRLYVSKGSKAPDGVYFGLMLSYKSYRWVQSFDYTGKDSLLTKTKGDEGRRLLDLIFTFGSQKVYPSGFVIDYWGGIGMRSRQLTDGSVHDVKNAKGEKQYEEVVFEDKSDLIPCFVAGVRLGYAF